MGAILVGSGHTTLCLKRFILTLPTLWPQLLGLVFQAVGPSLEAENGKSQPLCKTGPQGELESQALAIC